MARDKVTSKVTLVENPREATEAARELCSMPSGYFTVDELRFLFDCMDGKNVGPRTYKRLTTLLDYGRKMDVNKSS